MNEGIKAILVFFATFVADICWGRYTINLSAKRAIAASNWSASIIFFGALSVVVYSRDPWMVAPACAGAWFGTFLAVKKEG